MREIDLSIGLSFEGKMSLDSLQDTGLDNFEVVETEIERYMQMDTNT